MTSHWKIVDKKSDGSKVVRVVKDSWIFKTDKRGSYKAQAELQKIYEAEQHIVCTCNDARMFVRHLAEKYTLVNHPISGRHRTSCPFYTAISGEISHREFGGEIDDREILTFCLHGSVGVSAFHSHSNNPLGQNNEKKKNRSKLHRLLIQLCYDSFNHVYFGPRTKRSSLLASMAKLHDAGGNVQFGEYVVRDFLYYGEKGQRYLENRLKGDKPWLGPGRPHGFLLEVVDEIQRNSGELYLDEHARYYENVSWPSKLSKGPYLALSSLVKDAIDDDVYRHTICVQPVVGAGILMPINSELERSFALHISKQFDKSSACSNIKEGDIKFSLFKPLKPVANEHGQSLLPNFILQIKQRGEVVQRDLVQIKIKESSSHSGAENVEQELETAFRGKLVTIKTEHDIQLYAAKIATNLNRFTTVTSDVK